MPAFRATTICGESQNAYLFAHELGHYLGLKHTFREFKTRAAAAAALQRANRDPRIFEGDGIEDTSPDPYIEELQCGTARSIVLGGLPFLLQRENVMSYYYSETKTITAQQAAIVRATIERRFAHARDDTGPYAPDPRRTYTIVSVEDGGLLEAAPAAAGGIATVVRAALSGAASQTWMAVPLAAQDRGWFEIVSPVTGRCLTAVAGGAPDGAALVLADWIGADNQKWRLAQDANGDLFLEAKHSRRVLTAATGSVRAGARTPNGAGPIEAAIDSGAPNQRWRMLPAD
jgi:hypothetical protein